MNGNLVSWSIGNLSRLNSKPKPKRKSAITNIKKVYQKEDICKILSKHKQQRTKLDIKIVSEYLSNKYDYFIKFKESSDMIKLEKICSVINLEEFSQGKNIINFGEEGDKFYIVLEGLVGVYIPTYPQKIMTIADYIQYMKNILQIEKDDLKFRRIDEKNAECQIDVQFYISVPSENPMLKKETMNFFIEEYYKVGEFGEGFKFGEIALIKRAPRNATITALKSTKLLSIEKSDYNKSIRELEEKRLEKQLNDFKCTYPLFQHWTLNGLIRLMNCFSKVTLTKGDYLYKQNEEADSIYIVSSGILEVYSLVSYGWVDDFYDYIKHAQNNLIHYLDNDEPMNEKKLRELFAKTTKNPLESPCQYDPLKIGKIISSYRKDDDIIEMTQEEQEKKDPYNLFKVHIRTIDYKDVIGIEDALEVKKRFCFVKCISPFAEIQKVKLYDFFRLVNLNPEKTNKETMKFLIAEKKCILHNQIKKAIENLRIKQKIDFDNKVAFLFNSKQDKRHQKGMKINKNFNKSLSLSIKPNLTTTNSSNKHSNKKAIYHSNSKRKYELPEEATTAINKPYHDSSIKSTALITFNQFTKNKHKDSKEQKDEATTTNSWIQTKSQVNTTFINQHLKSKSINNKIVSPISIKSISSYTNFSSNKAKLHKTYFTSRYKNDVLSSTKINFNKINKDTYDNENVSNYYLKALESDDNVFHREILKMTGVQRKVPLKEIFGTGYDETDANVLQIESYKNSKHTTNSSLSTWHSKSKSTSAYAMEMKMKNFNSLRKGQRTLKLKR